MFDLFKTLRNVAILMACIFLAIHSDIAVADQPISKYVGQPTGLTQ
jgi:hypothetical protein